MSPTVTPTVTPVVPPAVTINHRTAHPALRRALRAGRLAALCLWLATAGPANAGAGAGAGANANANASASASASAELSVIDDSGATVTLSAPARRVISLAPHVTELIYAAGGGAALVGTVNYSDYPAAALRVPRIGDNKSLDLERIVALKPDLIVVWRHDNAQRQLDALKALHIPLFYNSPTKLDDVATSLQKLGVLLGTEPQAQQAAAAFRARIAELRARYAQQTPVSVFYQVWDNPLMTLNDDHWISDTLKLCGGRNVFGALETRVPTVSTEAVLAANPQAIVTAAAGATRPDRPLPGLARWQSWPQLAAVRAGNLFVLNGDLINRPTPRLAEGAAQLCAALAGARSRLAASAAAQPAQ
jgi:iron complex transport system substrate-binding protein